MNLYTTEKQLTRIIHKMGHFDKSLKIARERYAYESPQTPGNLPLGILIDGEKYILVPVLHSGVCDSDECQKQYIKSFKADPEACDAAYRSAPLYSRFGTDELCLCCSDMKNRVTFEPTQKEISNIVQMVKEDADYEADVNITNGDESEETSSGEGDSGTGEDYDARDEDESIHASFIR